MKGAQGERVGSGSVALLAEKFESHHLLFRSEGHVCSFSESPVYVQVSGKLPYDYTAYVDLADN